jgi:pilus assembly protein Flp/PilA
MFPEPASGLAAKVNKGFPSHFPGVRLRVPLQETGRAKRRPDRRPEMANLMVRYAADENGASAIEYGLVASLIAVAIIGVLGTLGINLRDKANEIAEAVGDAGRR